MTLKQFLKKYNGEPIDNYELADLITDHLDPTTSQEAKRFYDAASKYFEAHVDFLDAIDEAGYEFG